MNIRLACEKDLSRISEILIFTKRMNYRQIFRDDYVSFNVMQVLSTAEEYRDKLNRIWLYDDGIVKGLVHIEENEVCELYVDHFFQSEGVGKQLLEFAVAKGARRLWVLEQNQRAISFYMTNGFIPTGIRKENPGTPGFYLLEMQKEID